MTRNRIAIPLLVSSLLIATGCGDDPVQAESFDLAGNWTYSATSLTGILPENPDAFPGIQRISVTCAVPATPMALSGSNESFSGSFSAATLACELRNAEGPLVAVEVLGPVDGTVDEGQVVEGTTAFDFVPATGSISDWSNEGQVDGSAALGTVRIQAIVGEELIDLRGRWAATRN